MKTLQFSLLCLTFFIMRPSSEAQGSFQNLGFESATLVQIPGDTFNRVYFDGAFPGWRGYVGGIQQTAAFENAIFLCCSALSVWGGSSHPEFPIDGSFSVLFHAAFGDDFQPADTALAQTGQIPIGTESLLFKASASGPFIVSLGGQPVSLVPLSSTPRYTLFGADISGWAGQETELRFTSVAPVAGDNFLVLDAIEFSTTPVPEPSILALLGLSGVIGWFFWRRGTR